MREGLLGLTLNQSRKETVALQGETAAAYASCGLLGEAAGGGEDILLGMRQWGFRRSWRLGSRQGYGAMGLEE